eukprot:2821083-Rhodomonas_salina.1
MDMTLVQVDHDQEPVFSNQVDRDDPSPSSEGPVREPPALILHIPMSIGLWIEDPYGLGLCHPWATSPSQLSAHVVE